MFITVILIYLIFLFLGAIPLSKNKQSRELILYSTISIIALTINLMLIFNITVPSPAMFIEKIITGIIGK